MYRKNLIYIILNLFILVIFVIFTNPSDMPLGLLLVPIVIFAALIYQIAKMFLSIFGVFNQSTTHKRALSIIISSLATGLIIFQSVGGLSIAETILLISFCGLSLFYVFKLS